MLQVRVIVFVLLLTLCFQYGKSEDKDKRLLLHSDTDIIQELVQMRAELSQLTNKNTELESKVKQLEAASQQNSSQGSGATYVRWGRNTCPTSAELVYRGFIGGNRFNVEGGGTNSMCLPSDPTWLKYVDGNDGNYRGFVYGSEIDNRDADNIFDYAVNDQDVPCAVCRTQKASALMIPARKDCYKDWTFEYNGYIMGANSRFHGSYNYICMDHQPEFLQHGGTNDDQHILYLQEAQCGSLPCPPYVQGRELACVVCTK